MFICFCLVCEHEWKTKKSKETQKCPKCNSHDLIDVKQEQTMEDING
jgi:Zn finger protein HypA/HybF involved in hydrogenase expression